MPHILPMVIDFEDDDERELAILAESAGDTSLERLGSKVTAILCAAIGSHTPKSENEKEEVST